MRKNVFKTLIGAAAAAMVLGVAVGATSSIDKDPVRAVAVEDVPVYVIRNYGWTDLKIHYWGGSSSSSWDSRPSLEDTGVDATRGGVTGRVYKYAIPSDTTSFLITGQENGDKQTKDYESWDPNGNNAVYFSGWDGTANKGILSGCEYKNDSPSTTKNSFYVYDSNGVLGDTLANIKIYGFGEEDTIKPMAWPGTHDGITSHTVPGVDHVYRVEISNSYPKVILNNGSAQTVDIDLQYKSGDVLYIKTNQYESKYDIAWVSLDDLTVADGTYLRGDWTNGWSVSGQETMELNPGNPNEVMVEGIDLGAGGKVKVVTYTNHMPTWRDPSSVDTQDENYPVSTDGDNNAVVEKTGTYNIYVNFNTWAYWFNPTANVDLEKATAFATAFNTAIEGKCTYQGGSPIGPLTTEWGNQGTEFAKLSEGAKEILKNATTSHTVAAIGTFAGKYDYVYGKYGYDNDWTDFAERTPAEINAVTPVLPGLTNVTENNAWIWITVSIAVAGLGVSAFFFIKKRKEDR